MSYFPCFLKKNFPNADLSPVARAVKVHEVTRWPGNALVKRPAEIPRASRSTPAKDLGQAAAVAAMCLQED